MATVDKAFRIKNGLVVEGSSATVNGSNVLTEANTEFLQDTTAAMFTNGTQTGITFTYNDSTGVIDAAVSTTPEFADKIIFEGTTPDSYELTLQVVDPTQDVTVTLPNATDTLVGKATTDTFTNKTFDTGDTGNVFQIQNNTINSYSGSGSVVILQGTPTLSTPHISGALNLNGSTTGATQIVAASTASGVVTIPSVTGTVITSADSATVTNAMLAGSIANDKLSNSSVTVNGSAISLGGSATVTAVNPNALTIGTGLSGTSYDGSSAVTVAIDSTVATTSGSQTLTNKTISGTSNTISDIGNSSLVNDSVTINGYEITLGSSATYSTDNINEGTTNKYFTDERAQDAVAQAIANGTQTNITITYDDANNSLSFNASGGVSSISGTANQITASASTGAVTLSLPSAVTFPGTVTLNADPSTALEAATKQYVDSVAQGLDVKASVKAATTANGTLASDFDNGSVIDGVTLSTGDRILIKNQSTATENGIYIVAASGTPTRSSDMNEGSEFPSAFTFVEQGTTNGDTGWVCTNNSVTIGSTNITFSQFSGAGSYLAGNGLSLAGSTFSIDTTITADLTTAQTLTNKTLTSPVVSGLYLSDNTIIVEGTNDVHETTLTFTDPTQDNTITFKNDTGTVAFTADIETAVDGFGNAVTGGTGISASYASTSNVLTITNVGVTSIAGTADQISATASTGSVTLSLPQSIATTSSPSFTGLTVGSVTLTDALLGTATTSISTTSATVVDTWSATTYNSAKYIVQMKNGNDIEVLEVLVTVDGNNNVYLTEYADVQSNTQLGTTDADYSAGNVRLLVTSTNGTTVKVHKALIEA